MVYKNAMRVHAIQGAVVSKHHLGQVLVVANTTKNHLGTLGGGSRRGCGLHAPSVAVLIEKGLGFGRCSVVNRHMVATLHQVGCHGVPHHPKS